MAKKKETIKKAVVDKIINEINISKLLNEYLDKNIQFKLFLRNDLLFETKNSLRKNYPIFEDSYFLINDTKYIYKGIRIETY